MIYFILGSHPELSIAELKAVLGNAYRPVFVSESVVVIEPIDRNLGELQERLAGIVKVGRVVGELATWSKTEVADLIASLASNAAGKNKISFGLSIYDLGDKKATRFLERDLDQLGLEVKKRLKEIGRPVRYVKGKEPRLSSAIVETNGLLQSGGEYVLLVCENNILIGQTEVIQNFKAWGTRDYGRPARDAKSGMLPPKLARMMINLSGIEPHGASLLDPFCGSGTVLMEAYLLGFNNIIGSDINESAVKDAEKNTKWIHSRFSGVESNGAPAVAKAMAGRKAPVKFFVSSAQNLDEQLTEPVDLLVTEVFLGSPRVKSVDTQESQRLESELLPVFRDSFAALKQLLKPGARAVVAFPAFRRLTQRTSGKSSNEKDGDWHRLPLKPLLTSLGYRVLNNHLYFRESQLVARDIYVLTR